MAFNGSGTYVRDHDWTTDLANTVPVTASRMDTEHDGFATGLSTTICRDGQSTTTARIPFAQGLSAFAGTTSSVAYAQTNDNNTGLYFPGSDQWGLVAGGTATLTSTATALAAAVNLGPASSDGAALGTTSLMWSDLFLASGAVINFNNGDVTATHSANALAFAGGTVTFDTAPTPAASDGAALGTASVMWSDLFLASGAVINFNNGDVTVTHSANTLAFAGASSGYTFDTSVTVGSGFTVSAGAVSLPAGSVADAALATPGRMKLIFAQTASSSATIDFNQTNSAAAFDGTYDRLVLIISNMKPASDDVEAWLRVGTGGTPTYQTSGYQWAADFTSFAASTGGGVESDAKIVLSRSSSTADLGNATGENFSATITCDAPDASNFLNFSFDCTYNAAGAGAVIHVNGGGAYMTSGAVTAIRILLESGNIASGRFALYGIKDT